MNQGIVGLIKLIVFIGFVFTVMWSCFYLVAETDEDRENASVVGIGMISFYIVVLTIFSNFYVFSLGRFG